MKSDHSITLDLIEEPFKAFEEQIANHPKVFIQEDLWTLYWTYTSFGGHFDQLKQELQRLVKTPQPSSLSALTLVDEWMVHFFSHEDLRTTICCRNLLYYLYTTFEASKPFYWIGQRFNLNKVELLEAACPNQIFHWMVLWMSHYYPQLNLFLFDPGTSKRYLPLKSLALKQVIFYLPSFIFWNINDCMQTTRQSFMVKKLAEGHHIRRISESPAFFTKKMAHWFANAPRELKLEEAIWYGTVMGMGGNSFLATVFHQHFGARDKNLRLLKMLVNFFSLPAHEVKAKELKPLLGYLQHLWDEEGPFSMTYWNLSTLHQRSEQWYREMENQYLMATHYYSYNTKVELSQSWTGAPYQAFELIKAGVEYHIVQLTSVKALYEEGKTLRHCVGSYAWKCQKEGTSIWSLYQVQNQASKKLVTIEVSKAEQIVQTRGKFNSAPKKWQQALIRQWAEQEGIIYL